MAEPLKNLYSSAFVQSMSASLKEVYPTLNQKAFINSIFDSEWSEKELKQRMKHLACMLQKHLYQNYKDDIHTIIEWVHLLKHESGNEQSFLYLFLAEYVEIFGQENLSLSMKAIEEITQYTSCEFAIRPFLIRYPEKVMKYMLKWSTNKNPNIRRFSSEGCRPRLPWGMAIQHFKKDPSLILPILENLKNDDSEYVRKSVANNLNDIAKDNPEVVVEIIKKWKGQTKNTDWILKHGSRTLLKKAHSEVLGLFDLNAKVTCRVLDLTLNKKRIKIGDTLSFSFCLQTDKKTNTKLRIEFGIYYMKGVGKVSRKLFKITENTFAQGSEIMFTKKISFQDLTTRKHYTGIHKLSIVVNGNELSEKEFSVE